jgi:tetratricopeptide (TPR) repeat protein
MPLNKEDYQEPNCPFNTEQWEKEAPVRQIPVERVIDKVNEELASNDYDAAERTLKYWMDEAELGRDLKGCFAMHNEFMGLYRKLGRKDEALTHAEAALELLEQLEYGDTVSGGTCYVNAGTVYKAFGMAQEALSAFLKAENIFSDIFINDGKIKPDIRLGGLYNNKGLALQDLGRYQEARECYEKAIEVMVMMEGTEPEIAISCLNLADTGAAQYGTVIGMPLISSELDRAWGYLNAEGQAQDGNYAFVCEKCAPIFGFYGQKDREAELARRAKDIYERS